MLMFQAALLTRMSILPKCFLTASTAGAMGSSFVWSSATLNAFLPEAFDDRAGLARGVLALEVGDGDVGARPGKRAGDGRPEKTGAAGNERDATLEVH